MLRLRVLVLRDFEAPLDAGLAREAPADLRAPLLRVDLAPADFAREPADFLAAPPELARFVDERFAVDLRPPPLDLFVPLLREELELPPELALALPSIVHLPDMTRCAASATASAISEPSLVALCMTLLAAWEAVSAASSPASRIARRALGLALIAAAAAARPAASISLLIAPFASLSTVLSPDREDDPELLEEVFRALFAMGPISLRLEQKTPDSRNGSRMNSEEASQM